MKIELEQEISNILFVNALRYLDKEQRAKLAFQLLDLDWQEAEKMSIVVKTIKEVKHNEK